MVAHCWVRYSVEQRLLADVPLNRVAAFKEELLHYMASAHPGIGSAIAESGEMTDRTAAALKNAVEEFKKGFLAGK